MTLGVNTKLKTLEGTPGADAERRLLLSDGLRHSLYDLQGEPTTVLDRTSILVGPLVRHVLNELIWQIAVGAVDLYAVEPSAEDGVTSCLNIRLYVLLDLCVTVNELDR